MLPKCRCQARRGRECKAGLLPPPPPPINARPWALEAESPGPLESRGEPWAAGAGGLDKTLVMIRLVCRGRAIRSIQYAPAGVRAACVRRACGVRAACEGRASGVRAGRYLWVGTDL